MAPRPAWKGYLKLSLVTCAVELSNATSEAENVAFRILNRDTGNPVRRQYMDARSGKPVAEKDEVKGYEIGDGKFLLVEEEEIEAVQIESSHTLALDRFVKAADVEPIYLDTPYYVRPADKVSQEAFAVIREALERSKMAGLARIVLYQQERPALVEPFGKGMLLTTLRYENTVRKAETAFAGIKAVKVKEEKVELAGRIVEKMKKKFDPSTVHDRYEEALRDLVKAKKAGRKPRQPKPAPKKDSNVVNLFDALKKSLGSAKEAGPRKEAASRSAKKKTTQKPAAARRRKSA